MTAITTMRNAGVEPDVIAAIAGHRSAQLTLDVYTRVRARRMRAALECIRRGDASDDANARM